MPTTEPGYSGMTVNERLVASGSLSAWDSAIRNGRAQLLNDVAIRPWNEEKARYAFEDYLATARAYDVDPRAWEASFWAHVRRSASTDLRSEHGGPMP